MCLGIVPLVYKLHETLKIDLMNPVFDSAPCGLRPNVLMYKFRITFAPSKCNYIGKKKICTQFLKDDFQFLLCTFLECLFGFLCFFM